MAKHVLEPKRIEAAGEPPKVIEEFVGAATELFDDLSIARMKSPCGWSEPGQVPEFREYTIVVRGELHVETKNATYVVGAGEAMIIDPGEWVRYSTPFADGCEYVAVCVPAFRPGTVHREE